MIEGSVMLLALQKLEKQKYISLFFIKKHTCCREEANGLVFVKRKCKASKNASRTIESWKKQMDVLSL